MREVRYWSAPDRDPRAPAKIREADAVAQFSTALDEAVKLQMVSDVPFGAFLSGGLDSTTIVALMSRHHSKVKTFSVGFAEQRYSELPYAAQVAKQFGTEHHEIVVSQNDLMSEAAEPRGLPRRAGGRALRHPDLHACLRGGAQREDGAHRRRQRRAARAAIRST